MSDKKKARVVIDRATWRCGHAERIGASVAGAAAGVRTTHGEGDTALLNREGFMCCLGFAALQLGEACGVDRDAILGCGEPSEVELYDDAGHNGLIPFLSRSRDLDVDDEEYIFGVSNTGFSELAMSINDDADMPLEMKEAKLIQLFSENDIELVFVGEYRA